MRLLSVFVLQLFTCHVLVAHPIYFVNLIILVTTTNEVTCGPLTHTVCTRVIDFLLFGMLNRFMVSYSRTTLPYIEVVPCEDKHILKERFTESQVCKH